MNRTNVMENPTVKTVTPEKMLKVTALYYFTEALYKEKYEVCNELVKAAIGFGARKKEIRKIIIEYVKWAKGMRDLEAVINPVGRYRF